MSKFERPPCPRCNGNRIISSGKNWKCKDCGRQFLKNPVIPKPKPEKKPYVMKNPTKVQCCVCGEEYVIDNPNSETGIFYCMKCLKKYAGKTLSDENSVVIPKLNLNLEERG